jgi:hypothetical protein
VLLAIVVAGQPSGQAPVPQRDQRFPATRTIQRQRFKMIHRLSAGSVGPSISRRARRLHTTSSSAASWSATPTRTPVRRDTAGTAEASAHGESAGDADPRRRIVAESLRGIAHNFLGWIQAWSVNYLVTAEAGPHVRRFAALGALPRNGKRTKGQGRRRACRSSALGW